jgi:DNA-binding beta-propeller fold protein YncE
MRVLFAASLSLAVIGCAAAAPAKADKTATAAPPAPKAGIKTPGIQIPIDLLKPEAQIPVETPGWITAAADSVYVPNRSKDAVVRIDPKTNKQLEAISGQKHPCAGTLVAFASLWIPNCAAQTLTRYDPKANKIQATLEIGAADVTMGLASTADSMWMLTDSRSTLSRIDPQQNAVVGELRLPANCNSLTFGEMSLWVTCSAENRILRIDPVTNLVTKRIEVSAGPRSVAFGDGSVWVLCEKEGKVERIDPKTNKVIKTLDLLVAQAGGNLAYGEGFLWVTQAGFPLTRIDTKSEKERVAQQFWGDGGGSLSVSPGAIWLANAAKGTVWRLDPKRVIATLAE